MEGKSEKIYVPITELINYPNYEIDDSNSIFEIDCRICDICGETASKCFKKNIDLLDNWTDHHRTRTTSTTKVKYILLKRKPPKYQDSAVPPQSSSPPPSRYRGF